MTGPYVEIIIEGDTVTIDAIGFQGQGCAAIVALLADPEGVTLKRRQKPDYFASDAQGETIRLRQRA